MHLLSLEAVTKNYPEIAVLDAVSLGISAGEHIGVIGRNGSGKSTLLAIIAGAEDQDTGSVVRSKGLRVAALDQDPVFDDDETVGELLGDERRTIALGDRLGLTDPTVRCASLSGGQKKRLALALSLAAECDLLILDEPTNHLDVDAIDWLEDHLVSRKEALLLVTHDRYLLDSVANKIVEVHDHKLHAHQGTYEDYLEAAATRDAQEAATEHRKQQRIRTELRWLRRSPKARTSKSRYRVKKATELMAEQRSLARQDLTIDLPSRRIGSKVVNLHNVGKRYDDNWVLRHVDHKLHPDARIGIVGPNGAGKTTLLRLIAERIEPDEGKVTTGSTIHHGWYGQDLRPIPPTMRVHAVVREHLDEVRLESGIKVSGSQMLERFQFTRDQQQSEIGDLSGGERRRLELLLSLMEAPNLLLMDEPTNDLDIDTLNVLEEYLDAWVGALVVASHDRYFLDRVCSDMTGSARISSRSNRTDPFDTTRADGPRTGRRHPCDHIRRSQDDLLAVIGPGGKERSSHTTTSVTLIGSRRRFRSSRNGRRSSRLPSITPRATTNALSNSPLNSLKRSKPSMQQRPAGSSSLRSPSTSRAAD